MLYVSYIKFIRACPHLSRAKGDEFSVMTSSVYQKQTLGYIHARPDLISDLNKSNDMPPKAELSLLFTRL